MALDQARAALKKAELSSRIAEVLGEGAAQLDQAELSSLATTLVDAACSVKPPESPPLVMRMLTVDADNPFEGDSVKPGNILLDSRKLLTTISKGGVAAAALAKLSSPWLAPLVFLVLWDDLWSRLNGDFAYPGNGQPGARRLARS
jgi:hypothetical protein